jgi:hypothetical protein
MPLEQGQIVSPPPFHVFFEPLKYTLEPVQVRLGVNHLIIDKHR